MSGDEVTFEVDAMLFMQCVVDDEVALVESMDTGAKAFGTMMPGMDALIGSVADVGREKIAEAQAELDRLIEADETWRSA